MRDTDKPPLANTDLFGVRFRRTLEHFNHYLSYREKAAAFAAEAEWELWLARGCPADRSGQLGWSLLDSPKTWIEAPSEANPSP